MYTVVSALQGSSPNLTDFVKLKTIGTGTFGKVLLVQHRQSRKYFAMKVLEKAKVRAHGHIVLCIIVLCRWYLSDNATMSCTRRRF